MNEKLKRAFGRGKTLTHADRQAAVGVRQRFSASDLSVFFNP
jgi:hypothetical protein